MNYIKDFLIELEFVHNYSKNTIDAYNNDLSAFYVYLNGNNLSKVNEEDIHNYIKTFGNKNARTLARNITTLRMFYDFLVRKNIVTKSPLDSINGPKIGKYFPEVLTIEETNLLLDITPKDNFTYRNRTILELLYSTGLRISELVSLKFENINLDDYVIKVMGKGSKERVVPLSDIAYEYLKKYIEEIRPKMLKKEESNYLFLNNHGKVLTRQAVFKMIKARAEEVNIKKNISPHTLRHSFATHMLQNGADIRFIQELLGHSDITTTEIYTHIANEKLKNDYNDYNPRDN